MKRTALYEEHIKANARMVDFAGWEMPVQYTSLMDEHKNVRKHVGLFDVSHMGEVFVRGEKALETLQYLTTNDVSVLNEGQAQYSLLPNHEGGLVDDIIVYCIKKNAEYLVCVNASNADKDFAWMQKHNKGAHIENESGIWSQIAIQGPAAIDLAAKVLGDEVRSIAGFHFKFINYKGSKVIVAATGYTGEKGFEVFVKNDFVAVLWQDLIAKGKNENVMPIGLGARDTLRTEMKYSLYGNEIDDTTNPIEAGLGWVVKLTKGDFIGKEPMQKMKEQGVQRKLVGFKMLDKGIPRHGYKLFSLNNEPIGVVTSGTMSPSLDEPIGIGYLRESVSSIGSQFYVEIRNRMVKAEVVKTPFLMRS